MRGGRGQPSSPGLCLRKMKLNLRKNIDEVGYPFI